MVEFGITDTPSMHSQPPKSRPRFYRDVPLIRGTFETSLRGDTDERLLISIIHHN